MTRQERLLQVRFNKAVFTGDETRQYYDLKNIIDRALKTKNHNPDELEKYLKNNKLSPSVANTINLYYGVNFLEVA